MQCFQRIGLCDLFFAWLILHSGGSFGYGLLANLRNNKTTQPTKVEGYTKNGPNFAANDKWRRGQNDDGIIASKGGWANGNAFEGDGNDGEGRRGKEFQWRNRA